MDGFYRWSMRHGSRILFALAAVLLLCGLMQAVMTLLQSGSDYLVSGRDDRALMRWLLIGTAVFGTFSSAVWPLFGALVIDRLDRRQQRDPD
ncbi:MAG: hypothetical protein QOG72_2482 [Sphingomonadales bacterium]|jgi:hypothetical protein|nr:hypothetical protein [Sphingomonadales bacterium]